MKPETRYARCGDLHIAHQAVGNGVEDLVYVSNGYYSHVDHCWEQPLFRRALERLSSFSRLIIFDRRGAGLSDPVAGAATLEGRVDDVVAVMDAVGSRRAFILGLSEAGSASALFAATHPDRTTGLILVNAWATASSDVDRGPRNFAWLAEGWGTGRSLPLIAPSVADDPEFVDWWASWERLSASPGAIAAQFRAAWEIDLRPILPTIRVPTLVLQRANDVRVGVEKGRYLAERIPDARYVEVPGRDHFPWTGEQNAILDEIERFVTGAIGERQTTRALATVLFTDIVESTAQAARIGDQRWHSLLDDHDAVLRRQIERFRGRLVTHTGDGALATFDGPVRGIHCAQAFIDAARAIGITVRVGLHTGECEKRGGNLAGIAVHIGARISAKAEPGRVLVSSTVKDLVIGSDLEFADAGTHALKGVPGEWHLYTVLND